jgi:hypothetical protein
LAKQHRQQQHNQQGKPKQQLGLKAVAAALTAAATVYASFNHRNAGCADTH